MAAAAKQILVMFEGRKKILSIPQEDGIDILRREFLRVFDVNCSEAVITFQRFNPEFEEFVDIHSDSEVYSKEKLHALVAFSNNVS